MRIAIVEDDTSIRLLQMQEVLHIPSRERHRVTQCVHAFNRLLKAACHKESVGRMVRAAIVASLSIGLARERHAIQHRWVVAHEGNVKQREQHVVCTSAGLK